jgi:hypothetical protein
MSFRAALVVGNAVKNKIQHSRGEDLPEEDRLNELSQSRIVVDNQDETVVDIRAVNAIELESDPKTTPAPNSRWVARRAHRGGGSLLASPLVISGVPPFAPRPLTFFSSRSHLFISQSKRRMAV